MAKIFYQALRNLRPFTEKKDGLLTPDYVHLSFAKDKYHIARIKIDFLGDTQRKSQFIISLRKDEVKKLIKFFKEVK